MSSWANLIDSAHFDPNLVKDLKPMDVFTLNIRELQDRNAHVALEDNDLCSTTSRAQLASQYSMSPLLVDALLVLFRMLITDALTLPCEHGKNTNAMIIDKPNDQQPPAAAASITIHSMTQKKPKCGTVQHVTLLNNNIADNQSRQVQTIMVYDILSTWSHSQILESLKEWGRVLEISFKLQHKYQSV
ncbi:hypothetical protein RclHR1_03290001 [Rhizophagus clarus]|uniref:Uncharacterized protein n=1 Tax=Rhizophagus clarus TaxID=94130 RepID=A0A2Z6R8X2_9GLOM|nr:hypothetical protein RclHR1_03290001 [Rhizophagus clarus]